MNRTALNDRIQWNAAAASLPGRHFLQSWEWGEFKSRYGWKTERIVWRNSENGLILAAAQILTRRIRVGPVPASVQYVPKGPLMDWGNSALAGAVLGDLERKARDEHAIQMKLDPDVVLGWGTPDSPEDRTEETGRITEASLRARHWRFSAEQVQFRNTAILDLHPDEDALLAGMKQKTRYNIRIALKHGVAIRPGNGADLPMLYRMYAETAARDGFVIRPETYYTDLWNSFLQAGSAQPLIAEVDGLPIAALVLFHFGGHGWYFHGMSREMHREKMPNYLLQWEAIRWLRGRGADSYDLWGAPDEFRETDSMWGVYRFKLGFGAQTVRHIGAWDFAPSPAVYAAYHTVLPRLLDITRALSRRRTRSLAEDSGGMG
jgi:lipid II:glycine glycyltransferase (peptidoglycan interpeptide bridge formation enzyme)